MAELLPPERWHEYGAVDSELEGILPTLPKFWRLPDFATADEARATFNPAVLTGLAHAGFDHSGVKESEISIPMRDGVSIRTILYQPELSTDTKHPLVVLFHAGCFVVGIPEMETFEALTLVKRFNAVVLSVDYRMAPEKLFPGAIEDGFDAIKWAGQNAKSLGADPTEGFILGGSSAGGNITLVVSLLARDQHLSPPLTGAFARFPITCTQEALPSEFKSENHSWFQNKDAPLVGQAELVWMHERYKPDMQSPLFNPLIWPSGHAGLPPTYLQANGLDPLRDDALAYDVVLRRAGVSTKTDVYPGVPHDFEGFFHMLSLAKTVPPTVTNALAWLLKREPTEI